ncbi:AEC family transporter [Alkalihalobacterium bogoriense]|uniref:AEC family transporter n=1 Tax=Alkalihalobacterium bogoriense TaxID=246272 RepID=UPI000683FA3A|nr:AEC family transporter [Alkalihalobacterium bogoriense]
MQIIFDVLIPVFAIILCGIFAGIFKIVDISGSKSLNNFVYYIALPALLFLSLAEAPVSHLTNWNFLFANLFGILVSFFVACFLSKLVFKRKFPNICIYGMSASYGTTGYMGVPLLIAAFGQSAALPAALATLIHNIPVIIIVTISFELYKTLTESKNKELANVAGQENIKIPTINQPSNKTMTIISNILKSVFLSPLTLSVVAGIIVSVLNIELPKSIHVFSSLLADAAGPTALFALGLGLISQGKLFNIPTFSNIEVFTIIILKIIIQPFVTLLLALYVFPVEGVWFISTIVMAALPVGAGAYVFAQKFNIFEKEISISIVFSMIISIVTISIILVLAN